MGKSGLGDFRRAMRQLNREFKVGVREALDKSSHVLADEVRSTAPRDTGALAESVKVKPVRSRRGRLSQKVTVGVGLKPPHAFQIEYGERQVPANPFFRRSIISTEPERIRLIEASLKGE